MGVLATCGIMAIFIVIIYNTTQAVPDPVLSSTPWVICFLFFAEMLPLFAILNDLHRTALVTQESVKSSDYSHRRSKMLSFSRSHQTESPKSSRSQIGKGNETTPEIAL